MSLNHITEQKWHVWVTLRLAEQTTELLGAINLGVGLTTNSSISKFLIAGMLQHHVFELAEISLGISLAVAIIVVKAHTQGSNSGSRFATSAPARPASATFSSATSFGGVSTTVTASSTIISSLPVPRPHQLE